MGKSVKQGETFLSFRALDQDLQFIMGFIFIKENLSYSFTMYLKFRLSISLRLLGLLLSSKLMFKTDFKGEISHR